jgi:hypothetical protein
MTQKNSQSNYNKKQKKRYLLIIHNDQMPTKKTKVEVEKSEKEGNSCQ